MAKKDWTFRLAPDPATGQPRAPWAHQLESFAKWKDKHQYALLWEMGTGKTGMGANLIMRHLAAGNIAKAILVMPYRISYGWLEEFTKAFGEEVLNLSDVGSSATRRKLLLATKARIVIMNYDGLVGIEADIFDWLDGCAYAVLADESTYVKNARARRTKSLQRIGHGARYRYILTGTPMAQGPQDVFGQYQFLDPSIFGHSFVSFRSNWLRMGGFNNKQILGLRRGVEEDFNELVYSVGDRRTKDACLDMPPKNYAPVMHFKLAPDERKIYDQLAKEWVAEMKTGKITVDNGLTKSLRLAQVCTGFVGDKRGDETLTHALTGSKMKALAELLDELEGKFIIWCAWRKNVRDICKLLAKQKIKAVDYDGDTKDPAANELAFQRDPSVRAFVGTAASGGPGLNLQGPEVKTVIYFSQTYSAFLRQQSEDRAHRGDIKHKVTIIDMVAEKTIEEALVKGLRSKKAIQDYLLQDPEKFVGGMI